MSKLDSELNLLRLKLAALEEQKRIELEKNAEKQANPLKVLGDIIDEKRRDIEHRSSSRNHSLAKWENIQKMAYLEPIFNMLKNIHERLEVLEKR